MINSQMLMRNTEANGFKKPNKSMGTTLYGQRISSNDQVDDPYF